MDSEPNIRNKISQGKFTAVFLIQCEEAIGASTLRRAVWNADPTAIDLSGAGDLSKVAVFGALDLNAISRWVFDDIFLERSADFPPL